MSHTPTPPLDDDSADARRRAFLKGAALAVGSSLVLPAAGASADPRQLTDAEKATRLASNTYPIRDLFTRHPDPTATPAQVSAAAAMKRKYREITMLDFPQFTIDTFPGVRKMDLWSALFGDVTDPAMYRATTREHGEGQWLEFDPSTMASKRWLDTFASRLVTTGVACHHVSNNAPRNISHLDPALRREGIAIAKVWLDACATLGAKSMRVNTGGPDIAPSATNATGFPRNDEVVKYLRNAIESFKEMADYGGKRDVKVTIENHWGISADPMNMRIIFDEVNHPYCEASPDFGNWEHEYMLHHGLEALMPYTHTTVHAKYWSRWDNLDVQRCVRILNHGGFKGAIALEYEAGPWDGVEGALRLMKDVLAAL